MTPNCSGVSWPRSVMVSSVRPSLKYSCSGSLLRFWKGRIASITRLLAARFADERQRARYATPARMTSRAAAESTKTGRRIRQGRPYCTSAGASGAATLSKGCGVTATASRIGATKRYPRRETVSMNRGFSAESPKATRSFRMAVFRPSSNPTYVSAGHNFACNCSRVTTSPGRSSRIAKTRKGCSCTGTFRPSLWTSPEPKSISKSPV